ncbi:probable histone-lysine N-methyltransferase set-23 [Venturia canescens]|uniref:probable histone-lysine N-methyltransferase set-23 n=1 Tax=Venturia canescens TaxID=32260 RepID=UPI001C9D4D66|nr:probable histone-lysine N-methyltransferase set-23 [Venturia canescens]
MQEGTCRPDEYEHTTVDVMYVAKNIPGPGIDLDDFESEFSIGCDCQENNCSINCSCTRGLPNYQEGRLNFKKSSELIIECNPRCSCNENCLNKLVQHGPLDCLEIVPTSGKGLGLRTRRKISKNRFICEYAGEVIGIEEARNRAENNKRDCLMNYVLVVTEHIGYRKIITCIDPKYFGNIGRYCNHSCRPNAALVPVRVESNFPRLCLFAIRDIDIDEEITFDYSGGLDKSSDNASDTPCHCGADCCLGFLPNFPI